MASPELSDLNLSVFQKIRISKKKILSNLITFKWWARWGSNPRPRDYESPALTAELQAQKMIRSLTHPDTHPDSPEKHNSHTKFKDEINIHKLSKGGLKGYKIRWWIDGKRKEA